MSPLARSPAPTVPGESSALPDTAFAAIYKNHASSVYYLALRLTGQTAVAEDVTHDVFLKAFRALDTFRGDSGIRTWLYQITLNHCRNLRSAWYQRKMITTADNILDAGPAAPRDGPIRVLETKELGERIRRTLELLPEEQRLVLLLAADEQLSYDEIATLTEQTPDSVRGKLHRARKAFTQHFPKTA